MEIILAVIAAVIVVAIIALTFMKKRQALDETPTVSYKSRSTAPSTQPEPEIQETPEPATDPLANADIYINEQRYSDAIAEVKRALISNPSNSAAMLKLLQLYGLTNNQHAFDKLHSKIHELGDEHTIKQADFFRILLEEEAAASVAPVVTPSASNKSKSDSLQPNDAATTIDDDLDFDFEDNTADETDFNLNLEDSAPSDNSFNLNFESDDEVLLESDSPDNDDFSLDDEILLESDTSDNDDFSLDFEQTANDDFVLDESVAQKPTVDESMPDEAEVLLLDEEDDAPQEEFTNFDFDDELNLSDLETEITPPQNLESEDLDNFDSTSETTTDNQNEDDFEFDEFDDFSGLDTLDQNLATEDVSDTETTEELFDFDLDEADDQAQDNDVSDEISFDETEISEVAPATQNVQLGADFDFVNTLDNADVTLNLANQYLNLGEHDSAKRLLEEIIQTGNDEQKSQAKSLLDHIN